MTHLTVVPDPVEISTIEAYRLSGITRAKQRRLRHEGLLDINGRLVNYAQLRVVMRIVGPEPWRFTPDEVVALVRAAKQHHSPGTDRPQAA